MSTIKTLKIGSITHEFEDVQLRSDLATKEDTANKVTSITSSSTDVQYPSAKAVYDTVEDQKTKATVVGELLKFENTIEPPTPSMPPLCFTAEEANSTIELCKVGSPNISDTAYSLDGNTWIPFSPSTTAGSNTITLARIGDKVYFRNNINADFDESNYLQFKMSKKIAASGNCNSIYTAINFNSLTTLTHAYCYFSLFASCGALTTPPALPATVLGSSGYCCYTCMFYSCSSLTTAPDLPAETLSDYCYYSMFAWCSSLISAPVLPAAVAPEACYSFMFMKCTSLTTIPALPATSLGAECYVGMFQDCTSLQISDSQTSEAPYVFSIPTSGTIIQSAGTQILVFLNCLGSRSSNNIPCAVGQRYTYYTQNAPRS